ncbi:MAG: lipopolysaccharide assembly protein LapA domain-containing protein [Bacillota bacterium]
MRVVFIVLMLLVALLIAIVAVLNNELVTVNYIFDQIEVTLFTVILGATAAGILIMIFFIIYRSIHNYIKSESERNLKKELQRRVKHLENENKKMENELEKLHKEREKAVAQNQAELEAEKRKLEEELNRERKEREKIIGQEQSELEAEKEKLEKELRKQQEQQPQGSTEPTGSADENEPLKKGGFWNFLKR